MTPEIRPTDDGRFFIVRPAYLHADGLWRPSMRREDGRLGYFNSKTEAQQVLDKELGLDVKFPLDVSF